jgi:hypothetical protein
MIGKTQPATEAYLGSQMPDFQYPSPALPEIYSLADSSRRPTGTEVKQKRHIPFFHNLKNINISIFLLISAY